MTGGHDHQPKCYHHSVIYSCIHDQLLSGTSSLKFFSQKTKCKYRRTIVRLDNVLQESSSQACIKQRDNHAVEVQ